MHGLARVRDWVLARIEQVCTGLAALLGLMGIALLAGTDKRLEARVLQWLPESWNNLIIGI